MGADEHDCCHNRSLFCGLCMVDTLETRKDVEHLGELTLREVTDWKEKRMYSTTGFQAVVSVRNCLLLFLAVMSLFETALSLFLSKRTALPLGKCDSTLSICKQLNHSESVDILVINNTEWESVSIRIRRFPFH